MSNQNPVNRKSERNLALYHDWCLVNASGKKAYSIDDLKEKYGIKTNARFYQIIQSERINEMEEKIKNGKLS